MASITIRNIENDVKARLTTHAAQNGRSMEEEARRILLQAVPSGDVPEKGLGTAIHELFKPFAGHELPIPPRVRCSPIFGQVAKV
ncbi:MAG: plasmid stabilization protein [Gammaproteobacteria bacterium]|nr:plasmid stabilization protein [Gammaproteobacteria bacterium]MCY4277642.1 plasmid stabilization protein [Gammaproteobacteria bacterium]